ncbi:hypothetical protein BJV78DRAFT_1261262 [Lactifluus subvellereus]|nr:hypothetical protein BJV78DRAFT_1261262 [Lactifluus subvellereus]
MVMRAYTSGHVSWQLNIITLVATCFFYIVTVGLRLPFFGSLAPQAPRLPVSTSESNGSQRSRAPPKCDPPSPIEPRKETARPQGHQREYVPVEPWIFNGG